MEFFRPAVVDYKKFMADRGFTDHITNATGYFYMTRDLVAKYLGSDPGSDGVCIPYFNPDGSEIMEGSLPFARIRLLQNVVGGKYRQRFKSGVHVYLTRGMDWDNVLADTHQPLIITEGEFKADTVNLNIGGNAWHPVIGLGGVDSWWDKRSNYIAGHLRQTDWRGREVIIIFDVDLPTGYKPQVSASIERLAGYLTGQGAHVFVGKLPVPDGTSGKTALDDYYRQGGSWENIQFEEAGIDQLQLTLAEFASNDGKGVRRLSDGKLYSINEFERDVVANRFVYDDKGKPTPVARRWAQHPRKLVIKRDVFDPSQPHGLVELSDGIGFNICKGFAHNPEQNDEAVKLWYEFVEGMFSDEPSLAELFHGWVANIFQFPTLRNKTCWIINSPHQGIGKSLLFESIGRVVGPYMYRQIEPGGLFGDFNGWVSGCLLAVCNEPSTESRAHAGKLKSLITDDTVIVNTKYVAQYEVPNLINLALTTNEKITHRLIAESRREIVYRPPYTRDDHEWKDYLASRIVPLTIGEAWGIKGLMYHYLYEFELNGYDRNAAAPLTTAKDIMAIQGMSKAEELAQELISLCPDGALIGNNVLRAWLGGDEDLRRIVMKVLVDSGRVQRDLAVLVDGRTEKCFSVDGVKPGVTAYKESLKVLLGKG